MLFASVERRQIDADFQGGDLTSDGGLPLLREVDRKIGLIDALNAAIRDPRFQPLVEHDQRTILAQRMGWFRPRGCPCVSAETLMWLSHSYRRQCSSHEPGGRFGVYCDHRCTDAQECHHLFYYPPCSLPDGSPARAATVPANCHGRGIGRG